MGANDSRLCPPYKSTIKKHVKLKRFYNAIILNKIICEVPLSSLSSQFGVECGALQSMQTSAAYFASSLSLFCAKLNYDCMAAIILQFAQRLNFGVNAELLPLMKISHIKSFRARMLFQFGLHSIEQIVDASLETLILALSSQSKFSTNQQQKQLIVSIAQKIKYEANTILNRRQNILFEQEK